MLPALRDVPVLALLRVEPVRDLAVFATARFFLEPLFCEPWAALVVNAYPIFGNGPTGIVIIMVNHNYRDVDLGRPTGVSVMYNASASLAY